MKAEEEAYAAQQRTIEGLEGDVEAARSEVFAAVNAATALRHAMEHASGARARISEQLHKLEIEGSDLRVEADRARRNWRPEKRRWRARRTPWTPCGSNVPP